MGEEIICQAIEEDSIFEAEVILSSEKLGERVIMARFYHRGDAIAWARQRARALHMPFRDGT